MGRPLKIAKSSTVDTGYSNPSGYGVVGGDTNTAVNQIACRVNITGSTETTGFIVRQKGATKFLVTDSFGNTGICSLANLPNGSLTANTMTVTATLGDATTVLLASLSDHYGYDFNNNGYYLTFNPASSVIPAGGIYLEAQVNSA